MIRLLFSRTTGRAVPALVVLLFLATALADTAVRDEGILARAPLAEYTGSVACAECHEERHRDWAGRHMSHFVRYRRDIEGPLPGDWRDSPVAADEVMLVVRRRREPAFAYDDWQVAPDQYHLRKQQWQRRNKWRGHDYRLRCGPCHLLALEPESRAFVELNVGCEACHGPGRAHVAEPEQVEMQVPGETDNREVIDTCRRCHNQRNKHARPLQGFGGRFHDTVETP